VDIDVTHNPEKRRFEADVEGQQAMLTYFLQDRRIVFNHTEVPEALEGQGVGSRLAKAALDYAREHHLQVTPQCPFVAAYIARHAEYSSLLA
jgi:predicted GNAT family acetyltransferase